MLERIDLPENSNWQLNAEREAWLLVVEGHAQIGLVNAFVSEAIFVEADQASLKVGPHGLKALLAYPGPTPIRGLLQDLDRTKASFPDGELWRSGTQWRAPPGPSIRRRAGACAVDHLQRSVPLLPVNVHTGFGSGPVNSISQHWPFEAIGGDTTNVTRIGAAPGATG